MTMKANELKVTVAQTGNVQEVNFIEGMTVKQALEAANISAGGRGQQVRLNNTTCGDLDTVLAAGDQVLVVGNIRGA